MTAVPQDQFAGSRRIGHGATIVTVEQARYAHVVGDGAPVTPTEQSVIIRRQNAAPVSRPPAGCADARGGVEEHAPGASRDVRVARGSAEDQRQQASGSASDLADARRAADRGDAEQHER